MRIAVAGVGTLAAHLLNALAESSHEIVAVLQNGRKKRGFARAVARLVARIGAAERDAMAFALQNNIPVLWLDTLDEQELAPLRDLESDVLLVGGFSIILKRPLLDLPRIGCVNTHSSLLPKHRGPNPFAAVVLAGETTSGVTFHIVDEGIDTGDIVAQFPFGVGPKDTSADVHRKACLEAAQHVVEVMDRIEAEGLSGTPQNHAEATYDKKLEGDALRVRWDRPAADIERLTRACRAPSPWFIHRGKRITLIQTRACDVKRTGPPGTILTVAPRLVVAAGDGAVEIVLAYAGRAIPVVWPTRSARLAPGEPIG